MKLFIRMMGLFIMVSVLTISACEGEDNNNNPSVVVPSEEPVVEVIEDHDFKIHLIASKLPDGSLAVQLDREEDDASLQLKSSIELAGKIYQYIHVVHGDHRLTDALISFDPDEMETNVHFMSPMLDQFVHNNEKIEFLDQNGVLIGSVQAENGKSIEVLDWVDSTTAVIKQFSFHKSEDGYGSESDMSYFLYDIFHDKKIALDRFDRPSHSSNRETAYRVQVVDNVIIYSKFKSVFEESGGLDDGMTRVESYLYKGKDHKAEFRKQGTLPYGVYVPSFMNQRVLPNGTEWGYSEPTISFAMFDGKLVRPTYEFTDSEQNIYKEYVGSRREGEDRTVDYYSVRDRENELIIKLTYTKEEKKAIHPLFLSMLSSIKYVHAHEQFEPGVFIAYDEKSMNETESAVLTVVIDNMKAITAKDAKAFASMLEYPELAEALQFLINDGRLYRFEELEGIQAIDDKRVNVGVRYRALSEEGFLISSAWTFTLRQNKSGAWKIANID